MEIDFTNPEAEGMTIGAILKQPMTMDTIGTILEPEDFYYADHRRAYELARELYEENKLDFHTMTVKLNERHPDIRPDYLPGCRGAVATLHLVKDYAEKVKELSVYRKGLWLADQIRTITLEGDHRAEDYVTEIQQLVNELSVSRPGNMVQMSKFIGPHIKSKRNQEKKVYPLLHIKDIDDWMKGIGDNRLIVVAGRPGTGKTAFTLQSCKNIAFQGFGAVPMFSLEMSAEELTDRVLANISGVEFGKIAHNDLSEDEHQKLEKAEEIFDNIPFFIDDTARMNMAYIASQCRKLKREHGRLGAVAIDYLGLVDKNQRKNESTSDAIGRMTRECKLLARELQCSIFLLVQMNREIDKRSVKRPVLSDLRDSGNIEQDADMVIFLHKDEEKSSARITAVDFIVAKGRQTGLRDFNLSFYGDIQRITGRYV